MIYEVSASDLLILEDTVSPNIKAETLEDTLGFSESVFSNFLYASATDTLRLNSYAVSIGNELYLEIAETLEFTDSTHPRTLVETIDEFLFMWDVIEQPLAGVIFDSFALGEVVVFTNSKLVGPDTVTFTDSLTILFMPNKTLEESIVFSDSVSSVVINALSPYLPQ